MSAAAQDLGTNTWSQPHLLDTAHCFPLDSPEARQLSFWHGHWSQDKTPKSLDNEALPRWWKVIAGSQVRILCVAESRCRYWEDGGTGHVGLKQQWKWRFQRGGSWGCHRAQAQKVSMGEWGYLEHGCGRQDTACFGWWTWNLHKMPQLAKCLT